MRITKQLANDIAKKLTSKNLQEITDAKTKLKSKSKEFAIKKIPTEVMEMFAKYPKVFEATRSIRFTNVDLHFKWWSIEGDIPDFFENYTPISDADAKTLKKLNDNIRQLENENKDLFRQIEIALIGLKTFKNVERDFPEAAKHLPTPATSTALTVNLDSIRKKL